MTELVRIKERKSRKEVEESLAISHYTALGFFWGFIYLFFKKSTLSHTPSSSLTHTHGLFNNFKMAQFWNGLIHHQHNKTPALIPFHL